MRHVDNHICLLFMAQSMLGPGGKANVGTFASGLTEWPVKELEVLGLRD